MKFILEIEANKTDGPRQDVTAVSEALADEVGALVVEVDESLYEITSVQPVT